MSYDSYTSYGTVWSMFFCADIFSYLISTLSDVIRVISSFLRVRTLYFPRENRAFIRIHNGPLMTYRAV